MEIYNRSLFRAGAFLFILCLCFYYFTSVSNNYLLTPMILGIILMLLGLKKPKAAKN
jgi:hypothetical protein